MAELLELAKRLRVVAVNEKQYVGLATDLTSAAAALEQAHAAISAQEDRRIELAHQLATALNDLGRANAELAAERSNRVVAEAHWRDNMEVLQMKLDAAGRERCPNVKVSGDGIHFCDALNAKLRADEATLVLGALGVIGGGYCFCSHERDPDKPDHQPECRDARAFLATGKKEG